MPDFIEIYDGALSSDQCKNITDYIDRSPLVRGTVGNNKKLDLEAKNAWQLKGPAFDDDKLPSNYLGESLCSHTDYYLETYPLLEQIGSWSLDRRYALQKYNPGGGYFLNHCENDALQHSSRVLVWMIYLNTVTEGGGTKFDHYNRTIDAKEGRLVIWPAGWTHFHKGIVSKTETKYIATGWYVYE